MTGADHQDEPGPAAAAGAGPASAGPAGAGLAGAGLPPGGLSWSRELDVEALLAAAGGLAGQPPAGRAAADADADLAEYLEAVEAGRSRVVPLATVAGRVIETLPAGPELAGWLAAGPVAGLEDRAVGGAAASYRRLASWAQAGELSAVAELASRSAAADERIGVDGQGRPGRLPGDACAEVSLALTMSQGTASWWTDLGVTLRWRLAATGAALRAGLIDLGRAQVIAEATALLDDQTARAVEARLLAGAGEKTKAALRAALRRAVIAADPAGAERRRQDAERQAKVVLYPEAEGTASLAGYSLPGVRAAAAMARVTALARALKASGAGGGIDLLRAQVFLGLLLGTLPYIPPPAGAPPGQEPPGQEPPGQEPPGQEPPGGSPPGGSPPGGSPPGGSPPGGTPPGDGLPDEGLPGDDESPDCGHRGDRDDDRGGQRHRRDGGRSDRAGRRDDRDDQRNHQGHQRDNRGDQRNHQGDQGDQRDNRGDQRGGPDQRHDQRGGPDQRHDQDDQRDDQGDQEARPPPAWPDVPPLLQPGPAAMGSLRPAGGGLLDLRLPWATLTGQSPEPGFLGRLGPVTATQASYLADVAARDPAVRWRVILTDPGGRAVAVTGVPGIPGQKAQAPSQAGPAGQAPSEAGLVGQVTVIIAADSLTEPQHTAGLPPVPARVLAAAQSAAAQAPGQDPGQCAHAGATPAYRPTRKLWEYVTARDLTCRFGTCRQPAWRCDLDHTIPYDQGGRTCSCNLGGLCRFHHQIKGHPRWHLNQTAPGTFTWTTPTGRTYTVHPDSHEL